MEINIDVDVEYDILNEIINIKTSPFKSTSYQIGIFYKKFTFSE